MHRLRRLFYLLPLAAWPALCGAVIRHDIDVTLDPDKHTLEAVDRVTLSRAFVNTRGGKLHAALHGDMKLDPEALGDIRAAVGAGVKAEDFGLKPADLPPEGLPPLQEITLTLDTKQPGAKPVLTADTLELVFKYSGPIFHEPKAEEEEYDRSFERSPGIISPEGAVLSGSSFWVPWFGGDEPLAFRMTVRVPAGWDTVSQGERTAHGRTDQGVVTTWECQGPADEVYLIASQFTEYSRKFDKTDAMVFLREADPELASKYLDATGEYVRLYDGLIGPYPYSKFALVENFWETGYGMPSFTLLGHTVIRLPFILTSSYPHEILHNWWGNSVFVDLAAGNWCEGLTAYMADHLLKERQGKGAEYRRDTLQKYTTYVTTSRDFALREFTERHSSATQAVGYGKSLMLYHMLRRRLGDEMFLKGIRAFYAENKFKKASFDDIRKSFEKVSGESLQPFFDEWLNRPGAPALSLGEVRVVPEEDKFLVTFSVAQKHDGAPYRLSIPVAVALEGQAEPVMRRIDLGGDNQQFAPGTFDRKPVALALDPAFDVFRKLDYREIPPSIGGTFGAEKVLVVLPTGEPSLLLAAYQKLASTWGRAKTSEIVTRTDAEVAPGDFAGRSVWLLGRTNRLKTIALEAASAVDFKEEGAGFRLAGKLLEGEGTSFVVSLHNPKDPGQTLTWLVADPPEAIDGLARKLPHYGKYSYLIFEGTEPVNTEKGQWPVSDSPLVRLLDPAHPEALSALSRLPREASLADQVADPLEDTVRKHVNALSSDELEGRGLGAPGLDRAASYVASAFQQVGLKPGGPASSFFETWDATDAGPEKKTLSLKNVIGVIPGLRSDLGPVIVGAHYDHLGRGWPDVHQGDEGKIHPGADDNASGVAALIAFAADMAPKPAPPRTLVFVAFTGEEADRLGSKRFVADLGALGLARPFVMVNLDTVGRIEGRDLLVLGTGTASGLEHVARGAGFVTGLSVKPVNDDPGGSDQVSFQEARVPAVQLFSGPHADYHRPSDRADKIDFKGLAGVVRVTREIVGYLVQREEPLPYTGPGAEPAAQAGAQAAEGGAQAGAPAELAGGRSVTLGTIPDFAFTEGGYRLGGIKPGSPAEKAGLQIGDIIVKVDDTVVSSMRDYANALKPHKAGDSITVTYRRGDTEKSVKAVLEPR